jgi:hypothetical protein
LTTLVELLSCYSVFCQIVKDQPQPTPSQETIKKHKAFDSNKLRHRDPQAALARWDTIAAEIGGQASQPGFLNNPLNSGDL